MTPHLYRSLISTSLFIALISAYLLEVPFWILAAITIVVTSYDLFAVMEQTDFTINVATLMIFCYSYLGGVLFVSEYYRCKGLWFLQVMIVSISDILQYLIGKYYGKTRISLVSPNKTLEGYLGSFITLIIFYPLFSLSSLVVFTIWILLGIIGDVFVSWCKRRLEIKDISNLLGPHGGWLDRADGIYMSLIFTSLIY